MFAGRRRSGVERAAEAGGRQPVATQTRPGGTDVAAVARTTVRAAAGNAARDPGDRARGGRRAQRRWYRGC
ncbi:hypothetical protein GCM10012284_54150 [Mangrovihabitans endophyticus]|uniref:Uncharacterized protein n=1 Tax=Mangrovihabitans endophyticus TaxID=1751298 RepID=A0A8J3C5V9_9ACTN|nr:hypothetical protein GCM10012284_54150 [Mangrovihabitans endophyticus]